MFSRKPQTANHKPQYERQLIVFRFKLFSQYYDGRKNTSILLFLFLLNFIAYSMQGQKCGVASSTNHANQDFQAVDFYSTDSCIPLRIKCNLIVLRDGNGQGGVDQASIDKLKNQTNKIFGNVKDDKDCEGGDAHPSEAHIQFDFNIIYEDNTSLWDYNAKAKSLGSVYTQDYFLVRFLDTRWPALNTFMQGVKDQYPESLNVVFVENAAQLDYYNQALLNGQTITEKWDDFDPEPNFSKIFSGVANGFRTGFYDPDPQNFVIITNVYTDYVGLKEFGEIEQPTSPLSNFDLAENHLRQKGVTLAHEIGHTFGLTHECECGDNIMLSSNETNSNGDTCQFVGFADFFSVDQLETMQRTLANTSARQKVDCTALNNENCNVIVRNSQGWIWYPVNIYGDLIIRSGATLRLTEGAILHFAEESSLDIEPGGRLIIEEGVVLTSACEFETWKGMRVSGGNSEFDVHISGALIENTSGPAISMFPPNIPWPEVQNHGNGIVIAENNTVFKNCQRMAELIAYQPSPNKSRFTNCTQIGGKFGITNWHCEGVEVDQCVFRDIENHCIGGWDASYKLTNNFFYGGTNEVQFTNTSTGKSSEIINNKFFTARTGIFSTGMHKGRLEILHNTFRNPFTGILMDNLNDYSITLNNFQGSNFGVYCGNNGKEERNDIVSNTFRSNEFGILTEEENDRLTFLNNCFTCNQADVNISGSVNEFIGGLAPAGNCFTHMGSTMSNVLDMTGPIGKPFIYYVPFDEPINCFDPVKITSLQIGIDDVVVGTMIDNCHATLDDPDNPNDPLPCHFVESIEEHEIAIADLANQINSIESSELSPQDKRLNSDVPIRCREELKADLYNLYLTDKAYDSARLVFQPARNYSDHIAIYSTFLSEKKYDQASQYLQNLPAISNAELDFVLIQEMNIIRLVNGPDFSFPEEELNSLLHIVEKSHLYSGFAKSLYYILTGILIPREIIQTENGSDIEERLIGKESNSLKAVEIYPNPFSEILNVKTKGYENISVKINDISGAELYRKRNVDGSLKINASNWNNGVYIISIYQGNNVIKKQKIVLLK